jgi:predicted membrane-bound mannosyltransferase
MMSQSRPATVAQQHRYTMRHLPLAAILLVAAALRLYHLGADSLWYDELNQVRVARLPLLRCAPLEDHAVK